MGQSRRGCKRWSEKKRCKMDYQLGMEMTIGRLTAYAPPMHADPLVFTVLTPTTLRKKKKRSPLRRKKRRRSPRT